MRRNLRRCLICLAFIMEPVCHVLGIAHPEGLSAQAANLLATLPEV